MSKKRGKSSTIPPREERQEKSNTDLSFKSLDSFASDIERDEKEEYDLNEVPQV